MPPRAVTKSVRKTGGLFDGVKSNVEALIIGVKYFIDPKRMTMFYPKEYLEHRPGYRGFIVLKKEVCISCAACARICPSAAMKMVRVSEVDPKEPAKQRQKQYPVINYQRCIFCGYCVDVCPVEALYHLPFHDVTYESLGDMFLTLDLFQKEPLRPVEKEGVPVVYEVDETLGLVKRERKGGG
ncbi:MAG: NADH-quinone oxidoreductase subunit NuoI [Acidilobaceae archaeon]|nr:NADH-quinone oxidoreductase subunit NuoI [Acidilobaceae archaeon]MCX8165791.1 NADH-quinone oxidoreductase subunit NuoI [Acidilobaceae archaeon]MDW7974216.1 NADH-quinone oxidoreductase subunit NuoI [Sulfolobales archaeon]